MMTRCKTFLTILLLGILLTGCSDKTLQASQLIDLVQSNYLSIEIKDQTIEAGSNLQYLIDDFIPKLSRYELKTIQEPLPENDWTQVVITYKDGSTIVLYDNAYLVIGETIYQIVDGQIDLDKFYKLINPLVIY
ncbi:MAG: hypothetical protein ACRCW2_06250 [Cellulosilyticaceae bacterium]